MTELSDLRAGGKGAIARALTRLETAPRGEGTARLLDAAFAAPVGVAMGLTGPPGVGKSSLTHALVRQFRDAGRRVAVLAVDPSSRVSGGAILGDRTRIELNPEDDGLFMRSMAARGRLGGLSDIAYPAIVLLRALYDVVLVETVGVGQSEIEIAEAADTVVFCAQPGSGDALQFIKAGIMEIPDHIVVTKADLGVLADRALADLRGAVSLSAEVEAVSLHAVSAQTGAGVADLVAALGQTSGRNRIEQRDLWCRAELARLFGARVAMRADGISTEIPAGFSRLSAQAGVIDAALPGLLDSLTAETRPVHATAS
ncbi:MAG: methylmalonyl Co-A mutase-associated GTPase MeaB [Pseudomonadota bacterium]